MAIRVHTEQSLLLSIILFAAIPLAYSAPTGSSSSENITILMPDDTNSRSQILCTHSKWTDVATFFLANFFAHVATVKSQPGEPPLREALSMLLALVFPTSGVKRGLDAIFRHAIIGGSPLEKAKKAGALCEVIRAEDWKPQPGDVVREVQGVPTVHEQNLNQSNSLAEEEKFGRKRDDIELLDHPQNTCSHDTSEQMILQPRVEDSATHSTGVTEPTHEDRPASIDAFHIRDTTIVDQRENVKPSHKMTGLNGRKVHGLCSLPPGFELSIIPSQYTVLELSDEDTPGEQKIPPTSSASSQLSRLKPSDISSSYSFAKGIIAIFQTIYASATLYRTKGDQIERYGYAAFGLTVAPYLVMSVINLTGAVLTPDYPTLYMVESEIMEEARRRNGAFFGGSVGRLKSAHPVTQSSEAIFYIYDRNRPTPRARQAAGLREAVLVYPTVAVGLIPVAINGILSRFRAGKSTHAQRVWTMTWLAFGVFVGPAAEFGAMGSFYGDEGFSLALLSLMYLLFFCGPAIGGFVVVGQMLMNYGHCIQTSG